MKIASGGDLTFSGGELCGGELTVNPAVKAVHDYSHPEFTVLYLRVRSPWYWFASEAEIWKWTPMKTQALFLASFNRLLLEERSWLSFTAFTSNTLSEGRTLKDDVKINMVTVTLTTFSMTVRKFLDNNFTSDSSQSDARKENCLCFKLPYIGPISVSTQRRVKKLVSTFCSPFIPF